MEIDFVFVGEDHFLDAVNICASHQSAGFEDQFAV